MSTFKNNTFVKRINRFDENKTSFMEEKYSCIQMKTNMKSIKLSNEKFTNFAKSQGAKIYKELNSIYKDLCKLRNVNIGDLFKVDEIIYNGKLYKRLKNIIESNLQKKLTDAELVNKVIKCSYKDNKSIRLYFYYKEGDVLNLVLVDLYHLALYSNKSSGYDYEKIYSRNKSFNYNIENIVINN